MKTQQATAAQVAQSSQNQTRATGIVRQQWRPDFIGRHFSQRRTPVVRRGIVYTPGDMMQLAAA